jgi:hypothetical protein
MAGRGFETTTGLVIQQGIFEDSSTAKHKLGTRMQLADGRVFYYALNGAGALAAGKLCFTPANHADYNGTTVTSGAGAAIGAKSIAGVTVGGEAIAVNQFAEGWLILESAAGEGHSYKIRSHTSGTSGATNLDITLYDPIQVALTTSSVYSLAYNPFYKVVSTTSFVQTNAPAGVALTAITAAYYCWLQTWGVVGMYTDGDTSVSIGQRVHASTESGYVQNYVSNSNTETGGDLYPAVGYNFGAIAVTTKCTPMMLQLYP